MSGTRSKKHVEEREIEEVQHRLLQAFDDRSSGSFVRMTDLGYWY